MLASSSALLGSLALLLVLGLNAGLLWRRSPSLLSALRGPRPLQILRPADNAGEPNVIPFPVIARGTGAAGLKLAA